MFLAPNIQCSSPCLNYHKFQISWKFFWVQCILITEKYQVDIFHTINSTYLFYLRDLFSKCIFYVHFLKPNSIRANTLENLIGHQDISRRE